VSEDPQQLAAEIERTRERLGETVDALAAKADVKARAQQRADRLTGQLKSKANEAKRQIARRPIPVAVSVGAVAALGLTFLLIRHVRRR
jgi:Protein of unknown function (DUF3618)